MRGHKQPIKLKLGVCAMEKKVQSKPMQEILKRVKALNSNLEVIEFGNDTILNKPIEEWPLCDSLFSFFSSNFPLDKAIDYYNLRRPFVINSLPEQYWLMDRRIMYTKLKENGILVATHEFMNRDGWYPDGSDAATYPASTIEEFDDYIILNGTKIEKPFVEKPADAEDHNIYIYYPRSAGGGSKRLFRKVGDKSSEFYPDISTIRRDGSFIYEEFLPHGGTDVKVYAVGPDYAHAEARKSPVLDGRVHRDGEGKEERYPVLLSATEKETAWKIAFIFGQKICGFDLLRANGKSYVCDVNGCSFVKNSSKFYDDTAALIYKMIVQAARRNIHKKVPSDEERLHGIGSPVVENTSPESCAHSPLKDVEAFTLHEVPDYEDLTPDGEDFDEDGDNLEELRCVIAVLRHGDRTPKQKLKMKIRAGPILSLFDTCKDRKKELKLKSAKQLTEFLTICKYIVASMASEGPPDSEGEYDKLSKYEQVIEVLETGGGFNGINRKVQLKPCSWGPWSLRSGDRVYRDTLRHKEMEEKGKEGGHEADDFVIEALLIVKWGGSLTPDGRTQALTLGKHFRETCYPGQGLGFLRLHSTFRHDLKIYSSEEGRVQMTAAAFAKGFLDLEGQHLTPILVTLVTSSAESQLMLDDSSTASKDLERVKKELHSILSSHDDVDADFLKKVAPTMAESLEKAVLAMGNPRKKLHSILLQIANITAQLKSKILRKAFPVIPNYKDESLNLIYHRWDKLKSDFYSSKKDRFDLSKLPDIYDCAKYDMLHNRHLELEALDELYREAKLFANIVIPQEYGITKDDKLLIGQKIAHVLLEKIKADLVLSAYGDGTSGCTVSSVLSAAPHIFDGSSSHAITLKESVFNLQSGSGLAFSKEKGIKTPDRRVRTRLYFTSESHIHTLFNVLRYQNTDSKLRGGFIAETKESLIAGVPEHDYLTHILFKLYERKDIPLGQKGKFRLELKYSNGCYADLNLPMESKPLTAEAFNLNDDLDLDVVLDLLTKAINEGTFNMRNGGGVHELKPFVSDDTAVNILSYHRDSLMFRTSRGHSTSENKIHVLGGGDNLADLAVSPPRSARSLSPIFRRENMSPAKQRMRDSVTLKREGGGEGMPPSV